MGEFTAAAESIVAAESVALDAPVDTGSDTTSSEPAPVADDTPTSDPAVSGDPTETPPVAAPPQTATTRDAHGRFAGHKPGPPSTIPYQRFQEVTQTAKQRAAEVTALKERFGWIGDQELPVFKQFWEAYKADPASAFLNELPLLLRSQKYGARMRDALTEMIGAKATAKIAQPEPEIEDKEPEPDFYEEDEQGRRRMVYSPEQARKLAEWRMNHELTPIKAFVNELREERALGRLQVQAKENARDLITPLKSSPYFQPHREAIRAKFRRYAGLDDRGRPIPGFANAMDGNAAIHRAYAEVLHEVVIPSLSSQDRRALATSLNAKTGASNPNPARPGLSTGGVKPPTTFAEAAERILAGQR